MMQRANEELATGCECGRADDEAFALVPNAVDYEEIQLRAWHAAEREALRRGHYRAASLYLARASLAQAAITRLREAGVRGYPWHDDETTRRPR